MDVVLAFLRFFLMPTGLLFIIVGLVLRHSVGPDYKKLVYIGIALLGVGVLMNVS